MSAVTKKMQVARVSSYAEWLVILVVVVALLAGWGVKVYAENRTEPYTADGVALSYPADWMASKAADGALRFRDTRSGGAPATISVSPAVAGSADNAATLVTTEANALALTRGQSLTAYRILESDSTPFGGQPARRVSYAFVQDSGNAFEQHLPTVMLGEDLVTYQQGRVYVFSLQAPQDEFADAQRRFEALLGSATFGSK